MPEGIGAASDGVIAWHDGYLDAGITTKNLAGDQYSPGQGC